MKIVNTKLEGQYVMYFTDKDGENKVLSLDDSSRFLVELGAEQGYKDAQAYIREALGIA